MFDWTDPKAVGDALSAFDDKALQAPDPDGSGLLPHTRYDIAPNNIQMRALVGMLHLAREQGHSLRTIKQLESILVSGELDQNARKLIHAEIAEIEAVQLQNATASLEALDTIAEQPVIIDDDSTHLEGVLWTVQETEETCQVRFGCELISTRASRADQLPVEREGAALLKMMTHAANIWKDRLSLGLQASFTWRYISGMERVSLVLLVDIHAADADMATQTARGLQTTLAHHLPLQPIYEFAPITQLQRLKAVSQIDAFASAAEIVREEGTIQYRGRTLYAVFPVRVDRDRLNDLMRFLNEATGNHLIDINVRPTTITQTEVEAALKSFTWGHQRPGQTESDHEVHLETEPHPLNKRQREALDAYRDMLVRLKDQAYEVRMCVASLDDPDILPLATVAGRALLGLGAFEVLPAPYGLPSVGFDDLVYRTAAPAELTRLRRLWSIEETAVVTRTPRPTISGVPGIPMTRLKYPRVPSNLPKTGNLLGHVATTSRYKSLAHLTYADRMRHVYLVGRTGTGKTTLLHNMALQDIENGHGVGVVDPHGDLIDALLARIPPERAADVVLFDPSDVERPLGLNLLDVQGVLAQNMAVADFMGLMYSMYDPNKIGIVGPRFEQSVRNSMFTAMALPDATLIDVLRIIADKSYSRAVRNYLKDPVIENYWEKIYGTQSDYHLSEVRDYITSKFSRFTSDRMVRQIIGQSKTTLNFTDIFNNRKILLVNLAKGRIGEFNSKFLGFILVSQLLIAAFQRVEQAVNARTPFYLYLDEFQNFATPGLAAMLSEGRKYGLALTLAHQFTHQLSVGMREAIFGNVGTVCAFQVGLQDAEHLSREMYPEFGVDDLVNMPAYHVAVKLLTGGNTIAPFLLKTLPERRTPSEEIADTVTHFSRLTYGRNAAVVEDRIRDQFFLSLEERLKS